MYDIAKISFKFIAMLQYRKKNSIDRTCIFQLFIKMIK